MIHTDSLVKVGIKLAKHESFDNTSYPEHQAHTIRQRGSLSTHTPLTDTCTHSHSNSNVRVILKD